MTVKPRIAVLVFLCLVLAGGSLALFSNVSADPQRPGVVLGGSFPDWSYEVVREQDGHLVARVHYSHDSVANLRRFAVVNFALARQLEKDGMDDLLSVISFKAPLSIDEFHAWALTSRLRVQGFTLRVLAKDGARVTVGGMPSDNARIDEEQLNRIMGRVASHGATDVKGIVSVEGILPAADYQHVATDSKVFLVDVTRSAVLQHMAQVAPDLRINPQSILIDPTYPRMEDLGLANFQ